MNTFRTLALASAIAAISSGASAELTLLQDDDLQDLTGQAGLTIDVETKWEIGEFAYHDAGFLLMQGIRMGGNSLGNGTGTGSSYLDNLRLEIDIAGDGTGGDNVMSYGFSNMTELAQMYVDAGNADSVFTDVAGGIDSTRDNAAIDTAKTYDDGDLVIHFDFTDGWANEGGYVAYEAANRFVTDDYATAELMFEHAVDFRFEIDAIGLARSDYNAGDFGLDIDGNHTTGLHEGAAGTTTLVSQLGIQGYLGPEDLHIENNGNGFGAVDADNNGDLSDAEIDSSSTGFGDANSKITWSNYFRITDMEYYQNITGLQYRDITIHNDRGDTTGLDGTSSFGFAHSVREIYAVKDTVLNLLTLTSQTGANRPGYVDGIAINTTFKGDVDVGHLSFGDTEESVGQMFTTDLLSDTRWTISAH